MASLRVPFAFVLGRLLQEASCAKCPGTVHVGGGGAAAIVPTGWSSEGGSGAEIEVIDGRLVIPHIGGRAYFADTCTAGAYDHRQYAAYNLLGRTMRYTVDLNGAGCGCNAAMYLVSMRQNDDPSECSDYYCDANKVCGVPCAEIDIQEANQFSWHSTLHTATDRSGVGAGYGGGGENWNGPRSWTSSEYGPDGKCIDTTKPFDVAVSFPVDDQGSLTAMNVTLSQQGHSCPLSMHISKYIGMEELSDALSAGMTPVISYWSSDDMLWLDGRGVDGRGPCDHDTPARCLDTVKFYDFSVEDIGGGGAPPAPSTAATMRLHEQIHREIRLGAASGSEAASGAREAIPGIGGKTKGEFCCLAFRDKGDACGSCEEGARTDPSSWCSTDAAACRHCGEQASWCDGGDNLLMAVEVEGGRQGTIRGFLPAYVTVPVLCGAVLAVAAGWFRARSHKRPRILYAQLPEPWRVSDTLVRALEPPTETDQLTA